MRILVLVGAFLMSGCWGGALFYADSEARAALPPGLYEMTNVPGSEAESHRIQVAMRPDGVTRIGQPGDAGDVVDWRFVPLQGDRYFVGWIISIGDMPAARGAIYGLLSRETDGSYRLLIPNCAETRAIAEQAGARVEPHPETPGCLFPDRASLERGLRALIPQVGTGLRLAPLGHG